VHEKLCTCPPAIALRTFDALFNACADNEIVALCIMPARFDSVRITTLSIAILLLPCLICPTNIAAQTSDQLTADFDTLWTTFRDNYAYFDKKETDWDKVRDLYRPQLAEVKSKGDFVSLLERVLAELYDNHTSLNTNRRTSPRLVPTGLDLWAEWIKGRAIITQLRSGFSAQQAGLKVGMEIISVNGVPIKDAVQRRMPKSLKAINDDARNWALRAVLAGTHDQQRVIEARKTMNGLATVYRLDLPNQTTVDAYKYIPKVEWRMLPGQIGYIKINDLISAEIVTQFDTALEGVKNSRGLILDLRDIPRGGNTDVAEPIMGRLFERRMGYQLVVPLHQPAYIKEVSPRGAWTYKAPIVVLVNRWTASMAEGMAIGLDGMKRAMVVGTRMAGLNGGIFNFELPNTKIGVNYAGERLNHLNGTPRENFVPPLFVNLLDKRFARARDPILEAGVNHLKRLIRR
jgi:C-terminal processing protease CtpA/Prc